MDFLWDIGVFLVVLAELIFFHELGHFLAAKACGVYCDRFSLGMPPRLFGFRFGETDYCIGALPIGGYVKMAGQEDVPKSEEERESEYGHVPPERWLVNKPRWQRAIVFAAGPLMNLVLGVVLYGIVAAVGAQVPETKLDSRIGMIEPGSPAESAPMYAMQGPDGAVDTQAEPDARGWQTGDRILRIDGESVTNINDVAVYAILSDGKTLNVEIERLGPDGAMMRYLSPVVPKKMNDEPHPRFGVAPFEAALVDHLQENMPASASGLQPGDLIVRANDRPVDTRTFGQLVRESSGGVPLKLDVQRGDASVSVSVTPVEVGELNGLSFSPPLDWGLFIEKDATLTVVHEEEAFLSATALKRGEVIAELAGAPASPALLWQLYTNKPDDTIPVSITRKAGLTGGTPQHETLQLKVCDVAQAVTAFDIDAPPEVGYATPEATEKTGLQRRDVVLEVNGAPATPALLRDLRNRHLGEPLALKVQRPPVLFGLLQVPSVFEAEATVTPVRKVGIVWGEKTVFYREPLIRVVPAALGEGYNALGKIVKTLLGLVTGGLSARDLGGPVMIYQVTTQAARLGYSWLLEMTAFISINLCVFNLLPLPVLDGGHLMLLGIEAVRRKPNNVWVTEKVQQLGLVFIVALFLFITFNDLRRIVTFMIP